MAMGILRKMLPKKLKNKTRVMSAGISTNTGSKASELAIMVAIKDGIRLQSHRSRQITTELLEEANLILTMSDNHKDYILKMNPEYDRKTFLLKEFAFGKEILMYDDRNIEDPFGGDLETYERCYNEMKDSLRYIVPKIEKMMISNQ
jgi:protein-tyrosine-phosphatase